ncbi:MAG: hypothetical protein ACE1Y1_00980 [Nitrosomonadaceae bacterium]
MMKKLSAFLIIPFMLLIACQGNVSITEATYEPKIVIQGILIPGQVPQIAIRRNFPLNDPLIEPTEIPLTDASATITDDAGTEYGLTYNPETRSYEAPQLNVEFGRTYILNANATIDGQVLHTSATTLVPEPGFQILEEKSLLGSRIYPPQGDGVDFNMVFERSPNTGYYLVSIVALDPDTSNYIYDNPFNDLTPQDVIEDFEEWKYNYYWIHNRPPTAGESMTEIRSLYLYFYTRYRIIMYAADRNFRDFQATHEVTQGADGNHHEPAFHIDGDGIGVFGSAVVDTTYFEVLRP